MAWTVEFTDPMEKKLDKLDDEISGRILPYFWRRVVRHPDPSQLAEPLKGEYAGCGASGSGSLSDLRSCKN